MMLIRRRFEASWDKLCERVSVSYWNVRRWRKRLRAGGVWKRKPGPKKVGVPDYDVLRFELSRLQAGPRRTRAAGKLYERHTETISRRAFLALVKQARQEAHQKRKRNMRHISWHVPGVAWAVDGKEPMRLPDGSRTNVQLMRDLASQYKFEPLAQEHALGEEIAGYLDHHFTVHHPPLFLKRDNKGNINHRAVDEVLAKHLVIPLNSPCYYPPYNGGVEHDQGELHRAVSEDLAYRPRTGLKEHIEAYLKAAVCRLNHQRRRSLGGRNSCRVFYDQKGGVRLNRRERRAILDWIMQRAARIIKKMKSTSKRAVDAGWRIACEAWLQIHGFITVTVNKELLPYFLPERDHN
jgi:hypothetical protein